MVGCCTPILFVCTGDAYTLKTSTSSLSQCLRIRLTWYSCLLLSIQTIIPKPGQRIFVLTNSILIFAVQITLCVAGMWGTALIVGLVFVIFLSIVFIIGYTKFKEVVKTMGKGSSNEQRLRELNGLFIKFVAMIGLLTVFIIVYFVISRQWARNWHTIDIMTIAFTFMVFPGITLTHVMTRYIRQSVLRKKTAKGTTATGTARSTRRASANQGNSTNTTNTTTTTTTGTRRGSSFSRGKVIPTGGEEEGNTTVAAVTETKGDDDGGTTVVAEEGTTVVLADDDDVEEVVEGGGN